MDEALIAQQLKEKVTSPPDTVFEPAEKPVDTTYGQATEASDDFPLNELVQYKLHDYFGEKYKPNNEVNRQRLQYIYDEVAQQINNQDYGFVVAKIRDLEQVLGTANSDRRLYKLYQWLKLDKTRRSIEAEQGALINGG